MAVTEALGVTFSYTDRFSDRHNYVTRIGCHRVTLSPFRRVYLPILWANICCQKCVFPTYVGTVLGGMGGLAYSN